MRFDITSRQSMSLAANRPEDAISEAAILIVETSCSTQSMQYVQVLKN